QRAMAHELRTPLHSMSGWLHVLESRLPPDDPMAARALAGIRRAIDQQVELADVLTATARSLGGESLPRIGPVDRLAAWHEAVRRPAASWSRSAGPARRSRATPKRSPAPSVRCSMPSPRCCLRRAA